MPKNKTTPNTPAPPSQGDKSTVSALTQQLESASLDKQRQPSTSPKRTSSKQKSRSDFGGGSGTEIPQAKSKRSPKTNKANVVRQSFSTPSRPTAIPGAPPQLGTTHTFSPDLSEHYAGPTFHSSPAPSSLPVPSFFTAKSTDSKPGLQKGLDSESPPNPSTPTKSPKQIAQHSPQEHDDSPLALFFKADRDEKSRLRKNHSNSTALPEFPALRPSSTGGVPNANFRSQSPTISTEIPHKLHGRLDFKNHSTSELPFQMDNEYPYVASSKSHSVQQFRTNGYPRTGSSGNNTRGSPDKQRMQFSLQQQSNPLQSDLETSTETLKSLLSIKSPPTKSSTPSFPHVTGTPSPSPIHHSRNRSLAHTPLQRPTNPSLSPTRRTVSTSGVPPHATYDAALMLSEEPTSSDEDHAVKMEKELRRVLNIS